MPEDVPPADAAAGSTLAERGLRYGRVDPDDGPAARAWVAAVAQGFLEQAPTDARTAQLVRAVREGAITGVWDDALADPAVPVGTVASWTTPLTVPGGQVRAWAISDVTVAPTHRRRGIATALLTGELRTAVAAGCPIAALTVSEATIYGRYGFGPATWTVDLEVDARRAGWRGGTAPGRVQLVSRDTALASGRAILDAVRAVSPGDVEATGPRYKRLFGAPADPDEQRRLRFLRYDDPAGTPQGIAVYKPVEDPGDFTNFRAEVVHLAAATDDAYRALWSTLLALDLVSTVAAPLRAVDEPLPFLVADPRMIRTVRAKEHLWVRILDPVAALGARTFAGPGRLGLRVRDPFGFAEGEVLVAVDADGRALVTEGAVPEGVPLLELPVDALGSLYLGGASAVTLARAGLVVERTAGDAAVADRLLRPERAPVLWTWF